jgi:hypothetical protein
MQVRSSVGMENHAIKTYSIDIPSCSDGMMQGDQHSETSCSSSMSSASSCTFIGAGSQQRQTPFQDSDLHCVGARGSDERQAGGVMNAIQMTRKSGHQREAAERRDVESVVRPRTQGGGCRGQTPSMGPSLERAPGEACDAMVAGLANLHVHEALARDAVQVRSGTCACCAFLSRFAPSCGPCVDLSGVNSGT